MPAIRIREFAESDWPQVWPIIRDVVRAADTFAYDPAMIEAEMTCPSGRMCGNR